MTTTTIGRKNFVAGLAATLVLPGLPGAARAQAAAFPEHPVKIVVGSPPGQSGDAVARLVAQKMGNVLGQSVFIDNKPGAGAIIGMKTVKDAKPDGYTLMYASVGSLAINPAFMDKLPYEAKDFTAVGLVNSAPMLMVVRNGVPAKNLTEFIAYARQAKPAPNFGSAGIGFSNHLTMEMLMQRTGIKMVHVPYTGDAVAVNGMLAGDIDAMFLTTTVALPLLKADKLKALAIATKSRLAAVPDIPTVAESGFEGFDVDNWGSLMAPVGTPAPVVERLNAALQSALDDADVNKQFASLGIRPLRSTVAEATAFIAQERMQWAGAVKASGVKLP